MSDDYTPTLKEHITVEGAWKIFWDPDQMGLLTYTIMDNDSGMRYTARHEDGRWIAAHEGHMTVDQERTIPADDEEFRTLLEALTEARAQR
jgi:hypothetical protein